jgi:hypothetical protein
MAYYQQYYIARTEFRSSICLKKIYTELEKVMTKHDNRLYVLFAT